MKWIIKKIINFALPTKWMYFMFFKYKRNAYFIIKQHELLVAVRAGFMHYSLLKIFINSKIVWWCSCPSATHSPRGSEGTSNPKLACHMVLLAVELWEIPAPPSSHCQLHTDLQPTEESTQYGKAMTAGSVSPSLSVQPRYKKLLQKHLAPPEHSQVQSPGRVTSKKLQCTGALAHKLLLSTFCQCLNGRRVWLQI